MPPRLLPILTCFALASGCEAERRGTRSEEVRIFAASSLTDAFTEVANAYVEHTGADKPSLAFAGSQVLRLQINEGADADLFASADAAHVESLVATGKMVRPTVFAENELVVIVPPSNPASLRRFEDLPNARRIVVGAPEVPVGLYTTEVLELSRAKLGPDFADRVAENVVSEESNVRLVRAKVELGEADAAIVYRTDASRGVRVIEIPPELQVKARYHIGIVGRPPPSEATARWLAFLMSSEGQAILAKHGFSAR